jgi:hypothetical protein
VNPASSRRLRDDFDRYLATIPVPPAARAAAQPPADYIHYANTCNAR